MPDTRYARTVDGLSIAYQTAGSGVPDVLFVRASYTNVEHDWEEPSLAHVFRRIASFGRLILCDRRGTGLSDRSAVALPALDQRMDDLVAVLDAVGSTRVSIIGLAAGSMLTTVFAATYPERVNALVLWNPSVRGSWAEGYPWAPDPAEAAAGWQEIERGWGTLDYAREVLAAAAPSRAEDAAFARWLAASQRRSAPPHAAMALAVMDYETDVRDVLPMIRKPTLVLHRGRSPVDECRFVAGQIPEATFVGLTGEDHMMIAGDTDAVMDEIERYLTGVVRTSPELDRVLATCVFTDLVGSTGQLAQLGDRAWAVLLEQHNRTVRQLLSDYRGREMDTAGDGFFATFDGPARAVRCAGEIVRSLRRLGLNVRVGVHTGECEIVDGKASGIAVVVAARVMALAEGGQVLVTSTVKDLVAGSGLMFDDAGIHRLKGVPEPWQVYAARDG